MKPIQHKMKKCKLGRYPAEQNCFIVKVKCTDIVYFLMNIGKFLKAILSTQRFTFTWSYLCIFLLLSVNQIHRKGSIKLGGRGELISVLETPEECA